LEDSTNEASVANHEEYDAYEDYEDYTSRLDVLVDEEGKSQFASLLEIVF